MRSSTLAGVIRQAASRGEAGDAELLSQYILNRDESAFADLVNRYGGLVLGVARRQLADSHRADDVFQATFLALARSAAKLGTQTPLANWLFTVALRQARKLRGREYRRAKIESSVPFQIGSPSDPLAIISGRELLQLIDDEVARLPERYRLPVLLCCVEGVSHEDAARRLGWSAGAVKGRLERGRNRLAQRLAARGLAPSALLLGSVAVPDELIARTVTLAANPWSNAVPPSVAAIVTLPARKLVPIALLVGSLVMAAAAGWALVPGREANVEPIPVARVAEITAAAPTGTTTTVDDDPLPAGSTQRFGTTRYRHGTTIDTIAISDDGKFAVANSGQREHGSVRGYDLATGKPLFALDKDASRADAIAISPDGKTLATKYDHKVFLYDIATGNETARIPYPSSNPYSAATWLLFSPDGKRIALGGADGKSIHLMDIAKGKVVQTLQHAQTLFGAAFSPDSKHIVGAGYDRDGNDHYARLWDVETGKDVRHFLNGNAGLRCAAFSPDGNTLALGPDSGDKNPIRLFDVATGKERLQIPFSEYSIRHIDFAPDGKSVAVSGYSTTRVFDTSTAAEKVRIDRRSIGVRFSPDGKTLVGAVGSTIYRWDAATGKALMPAGGDSPIDQIELTPDGKQFVAHGQDGDTHVWDAKSGEHNRALATGWQRGIGLSPDGKHVVWSVPDEKVQYKLPDEPNAIYTGSKLKLFDLTAGQFTDRFSSYEGEASDLGFTPDGKTLVTVNHNDAKVNVWDVDTGKVQRSFVVTRDKEKTARYAVWHAKLSPDGTILAVAYNRFDNTTALFAPFALRLFDMKTGQELFDSPGHRHYVHTLAFSPDSRYLMSGGDPLQQFAQERLNLPPDQVFIWDTHLGKAAARLPIGATAGAFSPDGKTLATALPDSTIQLWDVATWKVKGEFRGHRDCVTALTFTNDGRLLSGSADTTVLAWDLKAAKPPGD